MTFSAEVQAFAAEDSMVAAALADETIEEKAKEGNHDEWGTPPGMLRAAEWYFNAGQPFDLDPCGAPHSECGRFNFRLDEGEDALILPWHHFVEPPIGDVVIRSVFLNPPYSAGMLPKFMRRAFLFSQACGLLVVCLVPNYTGEGWFCEWADRGEQWKIRGRMRFFSPSGKKDSARFPSTFVVFRPFLDFHGRPPVYTFPVHAKLGYTWTPPELPAPP